MSKVYLAALAKYIRVIYNRDRAPLDSRYAQAMRSRSTKPTRRRVLNVAEIEAFDHVADPVLSRVRLIRTSLIPPAADGMTVGRFVFLRGDHIADVASPLLAHELVHVRQYGEMGAPRFFVAYLGAYFRNLRRTRNHRQAYLDIPLEQEARAVAAQWHANQKLRSEIPKPSS